MDIVNNLDYLLAYFAGIIVSMIVSIRTMHKIYKEHKYGVEDIEKEENTK